MNVRDVLIEIMLHRFYKDFAACTAAKVIELKAVEELYSLATDNSLALSSVQRGYVIFRSAYTLEYIYFNHHELFVPLRDRFISDFVLCQNASAKRHFTKMMADLLRYHSLSVEQEEAIAATAANWIAEPKVRVAVKVWAMAILKVLRVKVAWVDDMWEDLEGMMINGASPAVKVRLKRGW